MYLISSALSSMGVYVFKKEILLNLLRWRFPTANDFGSEIIPASAREFFIKYVHTNLNQTWLLGELLLIPMLAKIRICVWKASDGSLVHSLTGHSALTYVLDVHPFNPRIDECWV